MYAHLSCPDEHIRIGALTYSARTSTRDNRSALSTAPEALFSGLCLLAQHINRAFTNIGLGEAASASSSGASQARPQEGGENQGQPRWTYVIAVAGVAQIYDAGRRIHCEARSTYLRFPGTVTIRAVLRTSG